MSFFEKLYQITDPTRAIPDKTLAKINENFKILEMTLQGKLSSGNILDGSISDTKIASAAKWNAAMEAGMGVDENCTGLWHFDNSLNNHKGIEAIASIPAVFEIGKFGKSLVLDDTQILKVATADTLSPEEGTVTLYASNLSTAANGSVILDIPNSDGNQGLLCGISADADHEGEIQITDSVKAFNYAETTQADFQTGTLVDVTATSAGDLELYKSPLANDDPTPEMLSQSGMSAFNPALCLDGNNGSNGWHTDSATAGAYILIDLGAGNEKEYTKLITYTGSQNKGNYNIQYSNDGTNFVNAAIGYVLGTNENSVSWNYVGAHRYWRLYLTNTPGSGGWANEMSWYTGNVYKPSGTREKVIDLSEVPDVLGSSISFDKSDAIQAGTFTRTSVAYKQDGTQAAAGVPRYEAGKFGNGVHMEEATTNLLTSNQSSVETDLTGLLPYSANTTITRDTIIKWQGLASIKAVCSTTDTGLYLKKSVTSGTTYTFSVYVYSEVACLIHLTMDTVCPSTSTSVNVPAKTWTRVSITATANSTGDLYCYCRQYTGAITFWADGLQLEAKPYPTSWQIGGTSCVADNIYYTLPNGLPSEWFASGVWVPDQGSANKVSKHLLRLYFDSTNRYTIYSYNTSGVERIYFQKNATAMIAINSESVTFNTGDIIAFAAAQLTQAHGDLAAGMHLWFKIGSGAIVHINNTDITLPTAPTKIHVGCGETAGSEANGVIDAVKLVDIQAAVALGTTINEVWAESFLTATSAPTVDEATILLTNFDNTLNATVGTVKVETALSTDGGTTYGAYQKCTSGQAIPGIPPGIDLHNARLKVKETLNTYGYATPQLHSLNFSITEKDATTAYGPHKSGLTSWDMLSLAWKSDRLSLVVNGVEGCFLENPGLPVTLGPYAFIGCGRNGDKRIAVPIDELRIDKKYKEANVRRAWYSLQSPFYTSDDLMQLPVYLKAETDGMMLYDPTEAKRGIYGRWVDGNGNWQYGLRAISGVIETDVLIVNKTAGGIIDLINGYGDGSDGDLTAGTTISVPAHDQQVVIKQYNSINIPAGQTLTVDKRICGLFLICRGDVTINGTIDLDGKGAKYYSGAAPAVSGTILSAIPSGGNGGNGGNGGRGAYGSGDYTFNQGNPGSGSGGSSGKWYAGGWGGAGGGGAGSSCVFAKWGGGTPGSGGNAGQSIELNPLGTGGSGGSPEGGNGGVGGNFCGGGGGAGNEGHGGGGGAGYIGGSPGQYSYNDPGVHAAAAGTSGMGIGGGTLVIVAKGTITIGSTGQIKCNGLNGGNGGSGACQSYTGADWTGSGGGGGQGGGGGGSVLLAYGTALVNNGTITVNGGAAGYGGQGGLCSADQSELGYEGYNGRSGTAGTVGGIATKKLT